jgi:hypothetical protein
MPRWYDYVRGSLDSHPREVTVIWSHYLKTGR